MKKRKLDPHDDQNDEDFNCYITFYNMPSFFEALSSLEMFHDVLASICRVPIISREHDYYVHVKAVGKRRTSDNVVNYVIHLWTRKIRQAHIDAQEILIENNTCIFPFFTSPRGTLVGDFFYINTQDDLHVACTKILKNHSNN